ncbi:MAG: EamA family transporter [Acidisphaera sp.]|nr:EamA family transporter [Acidisphaera sp.]
MASTASASKSSGKFGFRIALALAATYLFFGSGPAAASAAIKTLPPFLMVAVRGLVAGVILTTWALIAGATWPTWREWRAGAAIGVLILTLGSGAGTYGQLTVASSIAGTLSALLPLFAAVLGYVVFRERLPPQGIAGLVIGFLGIGLLLRPGSGLDLWGVAVIIGGQIAWAAGAEFAPHLGLPEEPRVAAGLELMVGGTVLLGIAVWWGEWARLDLGSVSTASWVGFGWFIVIAVVGFTAFGYLTQNVSPAIATTFSYVNPIVAMTLGWLIFSEPITWRMIIAMLISAVGVFLIVSTKTDGPGKTRHPMTSGHGHRRREMG